MKNEKGRQKRKSEGNHPFLKHSEDRYMFNIDRIAKKYGALEDTGVEVDLRTFDMGGETENLKTELKKMVATSNNFGYAVLSSPVVNKEELECPLRVAKCLLLNDVFKSANVAKYALVAPPELKAIKGPPTPLTMTLRPRITPKTRYTPSRPSPVSRVRRSRPMRPLMLECDCGDIESGMVQRPYGDRKDDMTAQSQVSGFCIKEEDEKRIGYERRLALEGKNEHSFGPSPSDKENEMEREKVNAIEDRQKMEWDKNEFVTKWVTDVMNRSEDLNEAEGDKDVEGFDRKVRQGYANARRNNTNQMNNMVNTEEVMKRKSTGKEKRQSTECKKTKCA